MGKIDEKIDKFFEILEEDEISVDSWTENGVIQLCLDSGLVVGIRVEEDGESKPCGVDGHFSLDNDEIEELREILDAIDDFNAWELTEAFQNEKQNENQENQ